eukprot:Pgem_evm2s2626
MRNAIFPRILLTTSPTHSYTHPHQPQHTSISPQGMYLIKELAITRTATITSTTLRPERSLPMFNTGWSGYVRQA